MVRVRESIECCSETQQQTDALTSAGNSQSKITMQQRKRIPPAEAIQYLDSLLQDLHGQPESATAANACGRVLAKSIVSDVSIPAFRRSMMDGFAVHAADTSSADESSACTLRIVGTSMPGNGWTGNLQSGEAVRVMTGAPVPEAADAVIPFELTSTLPAGVRISSPIAAGKNVSEIGEDIRSGQQLLEAGRSLRPQDIGLLSATGCSEITVIRRPRIRLIITGSELLPAGTRPHGHRIADSNGPMLEALVSRDGGTSLFHGITPDNPDTIRELLEEGLRDKADVLLVSGGSSAGDEDFAPDLIAQLGELPVHGISMRPGAPAGIGRIGNCPVFLLPGNPVACLFAYDMFAARAVRQLGGRPQQWPYQPIESTLLKPLHSAIGRLDYARVRMSEEGIMPIAISGGSVLSSTTVADGFVLIPPETDRIPAGDTARMWLYGG